MKLPQILQKFLPQPVEGKLEERLHRELFLDAAWNTNYVVFIISSCAIATFGLIANSTAVIIGAMLIAPLMLPLRGFAFAALEGDIDLLRKSLFSILGGTAIAIALACFLGLLTPIPSFGSEFQSRVQPNLVDLGIALAAGAISGFAKVRKGVSDALAGTAISVALMPPLCVVGLSISKAFNDPRFWTFGQQAFLLYLTNLLGIIFACMLVFIIAGYTQVSRHVAIALLSIVVLLLPLGINFFNLVKTSRLQYSITQLLQRSTVTIGQEDVTLINTQVDWTQKKPIVYLTVQANVEITPKQVQEIERFISRQVKQEFKFIFFVSQAKTVTSEGINQKLDDKITLPLGPSLPLTTTPPPLKKLPITSDVESLLEKEEEDAIPSPVEENLHNQDSPETETQPSQ
ncbi:DUF389 domain-containing protein [Spirulina sp. 06S082]|uniref:DUF389 domain-containing protein n=1 Tax=Spirulina sp. 06S082 TaxID=3110248 RepID=UPI002B21831B|nr:DUF389 domain-containing protein [Spirulina sp. 06S082]MEA5471570.1 DUF389 domain-containing protein [Spirulina sp. 06S082]